MSSQLPDLRLRLLQPVRHVHLLIKSRRDGQVLVRLVAPARAPIELAEAEMAVGGEGAHGAGLGEGPRFTIVSFGALNVHRVRMDGNVAQKALSLRRIAKPLRT